MITFYASVILDAVTPKLAPGEAQLSTEAREPEVLNFTVEAEDMLAATRLVSTYLKGRFEASGRGGDISHIGRAKARGIEYRGL